MIALDSLNCIENFSLSNECYLYMYLKCGHLTHTCGQKGKLTENLKKNKKQKFHDFDPHKRVDFLIVDVFALHQF